MPEFDAIAAIDDRLKTLHERLCARKGKSAYRDAVPLIKKEIERLENTRKMIAEAREGTAEKNLA